MNINTPPKATFLQGDCLEVLKHFPESRVHCVVTSPPYFGLRNYNVEKQIGLEASPEAYVAKLVEVFREVRRCLRDDGTLWLNLGDSYARSDKKGGSGFGGKNQKYLGDNYERARSDIPPGLKEKDLIGIPWRVAFALQADGWYLRQDIIWSKPNPMPESVRDRCTKAHEYIFLLSKSPKYYFDAAAIAEPVTESTIKRMAQPTLGQEAGSDRVPGKTNGRMKAVPPRFGGAKYGDNDAPEHRTKSGAAYDLKNGKRNKRSVWQFATRPFKEAHFATFPPALVEPCILAGSPIGGLVLDPFAGAGTTALVAGQLGRQAISVELNPEYIAIATKRCGA